MMKNKKILFIVHRLYFNNQVKKGGADRIVDFLKTQNTIDIIAHPLKNIFYPSFFSSNKIEKKYHNHFKQPFCWLEQIIINVIWILKINFQYDLIIATDPLSFFSAYIIKKLKKTKKIQFHSTDYSLPRFKNIIFEFFYQKFYILALKRADLITVVSLKMANKAYELLGYKKKNIVILPNSPDFSKIPKVPPNNRKLKHFAISVGIFEDQVDLKSLLISLKFLKRLMNDFILEIIGYVPKKYIKLFYNKGFKTNTIFYGILPYEKAIKKISECSIGITCYSANHSYVHYADSLKIREYAAAGLPIVCDNIYGTAQEVKENIAGYVYNNPTEMVEYLIKLTSNKKLYLTISNNALNWAKKMDKARLLSNLYENFNY